MSVLASEDEIEELASELVDVAKVIEFALCLKSPATLLRLLCVCLTKLWPCRLKVSMVSHWRCGASWVATKGSELLSSNVCIVISVPGFRSDSEEQNKYVSSLQGAGPFGETHMRDLKGEKIGLHSCHSTCCDKVSRIPVSINIFSLFVFLSCC